MLMLTSSKFSRFNSLQEGAADDIDKAAELHSPAATVRGVQEGEEGTTQDLQMLHHYIRIVTSLCDGFQQS